MGHNNRGFSSFLFQNRVCEDYNKVGEGERERELTLRPWSEAPS